MNASCHAPVFIVGTQRSGTTLLRLMLNAHSQIAIPEEARFLTPLLKRKYLKTKLSGALLNHVIRYLSSNDQFKLWNYDSREFLADLSQKNEISLRELIDSMFSSYCVSEGKSFWGDKSLFFSAIDILDTLFPDGLFIHIVRDGRDVFDSWRKMEPTKNNAAVIALDWALKLYKIEVSLKRFSPERYFTLRYEDLINDPEKILQQICAFIGVEYEGGMLEFHKTSQYYIGDHHSNLIFNPITGTNCAKWRKNLTPREITDFAVFAGHYLQKYGYEMPGKNRSLLDIAGGLKSLAVGLPKRMGELVQAHRAYEHALKSGEAVKDVPTGNMPHRREMTKDTTQGKNRIDAVSRNER